ncbi:MAG TPA: DNA polymerase III subunit gamma/tau [Rhodothermales bacterium]|nr:DNA polymerase III subunit gamma/tau [Rhodothermales bacterium]
METPPSTPGTEPAERYLVAARKYRPQTFADLVAQEHVAQALQNAVRLHRLAHAYLFSGPRGVGKTTAARLLAKAVNCATPLAERENAEPCRLCAACLAFEEGRAMNVIEIDAASNNKVDDIRELRETVRIPPQGAKKKVYILDEVHMLSAGAFNALLKTLEEPPAHALFIFATTEPHKVLPTILSRCQRFDFRRIAVPDIVRSLEGIAAAEGVTADEEALVLLARRADGALRDALSLFDQAVALCGDDLQGAALREALGVVDHEAYFEATDRAAAHDRAGILLLVDSLVRRGYDLQEFVSGLTEHLRDLLAVAATGSTDLVEATSATRARYRDAAAGWAEPDLLHLLALADEAAQGMRTARSPRLTLELALLKMASLERAADLDRLLAHLDRLGTDAGAALRPAPPQAAPPQAAPPQAAPQPQVAPQAAPPPARPEAAAEAPTAYAAPPPTRAEAPVFTPPPPAAAPPAPAPPSDAPPVMAPAAAPEATFAPTSPPQDTFAPSAPPTATAMSAPPPEAPPPDYEFSVPPRADAGVSPDARQPPPDSDGDGGFPTTPPATPPRPSAPAAAPPATGGPAGAARGVFGAPALRRPSGGTTPGNGPAGASGDGAAHAEPPVVEEREAPDPHFGPSLGRVREAWPAVVASVRAQGLVHVAAVAELAVPHRAVRGAIEVAATDPFGRDTLERNAEHLAAALRVALGAEAPPLTFAVAAAPSAETVAATDPFQRLRELRQEHPVFRVLFERFGAEPTLT